MVYIGQCRALGELQVWRLNACYYISVILLEYPNSNDITAQLIVLVTESKHLFSLT